MIYDLDTNEPVTPSALDEAEHDLLAALSLRQHADTDLKRETAARIVARCRVEVHRLRALEDFDTGRATADFAPVELSRAAPGRAASPHPTDRRDAA